MLGRRRKMSYWIKLCFNFIKIKIQGQMTNHLNLSYQESFKGTQTTGNGFSVTNKDQTHNITDLYKQDSVSSDQPVPLNTKVQDFITLHQQQMQHNQIKKFMKKAEKLNQLSYRKLHEGKPLVPESSTINIYKSNKNILDQISIPAKRDRQIRSIYLKDRKEQRRTNLIQKNTFRSTTSNKRKLTTQSKWVQTENPNQQSQEINKNKKKNSGENNKILSTKKLKKTLKAIQQDEDEEFIPAKRKYPNKKLFNTISLLPDQRRVDANAYLTNLSKAQHDFNKSVRRYSVKQEFKQSSTFYNDSDRSFLQPFVNQSSHWENMDVQQQRQRITPQLPTINEKTSILQETKKQSESNKQGQIKGKNNKKSQQMTQNSLFVENDNSVQRSKISQSQFTILKANFNNNFQQKQMLPMKFLQPHLNVEKNEKRIQKSEIFVQVPQVYEIAIGTDTNAFIRSPKKSIHPITYAFSQNDANWITSNFKPKSSFLKNIDTKKFSMKKYRNGVYFGEISQQGLKNGKGVVFYFNGRSYQGNFINDTKEGKGFEYMPDGSLYTGEFRKGLKEGKGIFQWPNGQVYDGQWIAGKKNGSGMWKSPNGDSYLGEWKNGKIEGFGVLTIKEGDRYEGQFKNSMKNGLGTERYSNGDTYVGQFSKNRPNGQGQYYYCNGDTYKGMFSNGLKHGNGIFISKEGQTYQGQFRNQKKCGYGQQTNESGDWYKGNFQNNLRHGYGEETTSQGFSKKGYWINGKLIETEMGPIVEDDLQRQQSIPTDLKVKKNKKSNMQQNSNPRVLKKSPKRSPRSSIVKSVSPTDPNFHRECGCKRNH